MNRKARKGISPIIATVLLILIAIATGVIIYAFATGWVGSRMGNSGPTSMISIDAASINKSSSNYTISVYVRNIGTTPTNISALYLIDQSSGTQIKANITSNSLQVSPNNVIKVDGNVSTTLITLKSGQSYTIKVVTTDGAYATTQVVYRG